jgi:UDP-N-acetylmuramate--alanine ligase
VSWPDLRGGRALAELRALGARVHVGHEAGNVGDADIVVTSTAVPADNPEVVAAREAGRPVLRRAAMLAALMTDERAILVAGTHGKTTTTSMTVVAMQAAGRDPSFAIGGSLNESGTNAHAGTDGVFVAEADESDRSFLVYTPDVAVVTNLELDHPEEFADEAAVDASFDDFLERRSSGAPAWLCLDDPGTTRLAQRHDHVRTYGTDPRADLRLVISEEGPHRLRFDGQEVASLDLAVPGRHNLLNASAAVAVCLELGIDPATAAAGLQRFTGAARRYQRLGAAGGVQVVDDYAHHPTELRATLSAARGDRPGRVVLVVQPHRYSRTRVLGAELGRAAAGADVVVVTEVFASSEAPVPGVSGRTVADAATAAGANVTFVPHLTDVVDHLAATVREGDLVLVTGAGDVTQVGPALLARLDGRT